MSEAPLTLMAVHAHPDDEAIGTGGILARYSAEGVRTVLVTCTNGELGDAPGGLKPGDPGHDESVVVPLRRGELEASCNVLGRRPPRVDGVPRLGHGGLAAERRAAVFLAYPGRPGGGALADLMRTYQPQVVVTYDENGFYGHPDHIQAHRITLAALDACGIPAKLYYTAFPRSSLRGFREILEEAGIDGPGEVADNPDFGTPDELVTTMIDVRAVTGRKYASLAAHASQSDNIFFLEMGEELFSTLMGTESFVRAVDTTGAPVPEDDLFAGLR